MSSSDLIGKAEPLKAGAWMEVVQYYVYIYIQLYTYIYMYVYKCIYE